MPDPFRSQARSHLEAHASPAFRSALADHARFGCYFSFDLNFVGTLLQDFLFPEIPEKPLTDYTKNSGQVVRPFDPQVIPPSMFDEPFGHAYYE